MQIAVPQTGKRRRPWRSCQLFLSESWSWSDEYSAPGARAREGRRVADRLASERGAIYEADPLVCPRCGEAMRIVAFITKPRVIRKILRHLETKAAEGRSPPPPRAGAQAA
jgi:hypothetical protein